MYVVRLVAVHARGDTSRPSARRMLTKGTYVLRLQASTIYLPRKSGKVGPILTVDRTIFEMWLGAL